MSVVTEEIVRICEQLPAAKASEVADFARFLAERQEADTFNGLVLSESALAKDWNTPEEDAAWASL
jgi:hypothetical protein